MSNSDGTRIGVSYLKRYAMLLVAAWSVIVFALLLWNAIEAREETRKYAHIYTNSAFEKDRLYRRRATMHGGVYVPVTNKTPPNPYLSDIRERDIKTPSGRQLTLMNPAYMTRQAYELEREVSGARSRITSLKTIKPENAPDEWEKKALIAFEQGKTEISSIENIDGREYFRLMRPVVTEAGCLTCHAKQGYKVNDIRGGISVSLPMDSIRELADTSQSRNISIYLLLWLVGTGGIVFGYYRVSKSEFKSNQAEKELEIAYLELEKKVQERTADLSQVNEALRESERKYRELVENANSIILRWSQDGRITFMNEFGQRFFGYTEAEILGRHVVGAIVPETESTGRDLGPLMDRIYTNPKDFEQNINENMRRNGERVWISWTNKMVLDRQGQVLEILSIGYDITGRKQAEEELRKYRDHLESLVKERTVELEEAQAALVSIVEDLKEMTLQLTQAMEQAQSADRLKSAFLATMSHELRTPLNSIIGFTGIVLQGMSGPLNEEQAKQLNMVKSSANHLLALINDVLDISKIEAGQVEIARKSFDIRSVIEAALRTLLPLAAKKGLSLDSVIASDVGTIVSDRRRVEQILINLVGNAVKFTERGKVRIECRINEGRLETCVRDTGIGMKPEDLDKLFKPFSQVDTGLARNHEGTGLGLSICRKLVEMLGGAIRVESNWGKGSTFTFTLPLT